MISGIAFVAGRDGKMGYIVPNLKREKEARFPDKHDLAPPQKSFFRKNNGGDSR